MAKGDLHITVDHDANELLVEREEQTYDCVRDEGGCDCCGPMMGSVTISTIEYEGPIPPAHRSDSAH